MPNPDQLQKASSCLFKASEGQDHQNVYVILDAARDEKIYPKIKEADNESSCLFHGKKAVEMATVAPYLVSLEDGDPFTEWLMENGWGNSWGIFLQSPEELMKLTRHFRRFLMVYDENGKPLYFRFYDPRVFRVYLPTCNESEVETVYGPVTRYYMEGKEENQLIEYSCTKDFKLVENVVEL